MPVMSLCYETFQATKQTHKLVDHHKFVRSISLPKYKNIYLDMIKCVTTILESQMHLFIPDALSNKLKRNTNFISFNPVLYTLQQRILLDTSDKCMFLCQVYLWYLSLMSGGRILSKKFLEVDPNCDVSIFKFQENTKQELKNFIDSQLTKVIERKGFIFNCDRMYHIIKETFDQIMEIQPATKSLKKTFTY